MSTAGPLPPGEGDRAIFVSPGPERTLAPLEVENTAAPALGSNVATVEGTNATQASIEPRPAPFEIIDLSDDRVFLQSLMNSVPSTEIFESVKPVYAVVFKKAAQLVQYHRTKRQLCDDLHAASLEIPKANQRWFKRRSTKAWPSLLKKADDILQGELESLQQMEEQILDPANKRTFAAIVERQEAKIGTLSRGIQACSRVIADLEKHGLYN